MKKILTINVSSITPLAMGGADRNNYEFSPKGLKSMMRFWWRVLNFDKFKSIRDLYKNEVDLFGGSYKILINEEKEEEIKIKSPINISFDNYNFKQSESISLTPHHDNADFCIENKCLFTCKTRKHPHDNAQYCKVNNCELTCSKSIKKNRILVENLNIEFIYETNIWKKDDLISLIKTCFLLGGFGNRSKRGFGSININSIDKKEFSFKEQIKHLVNVEKNTILTKLIIGEDKLIDVNTALTNIGYATHYFNTGNPSHCFVTINNNDDNNIYPIICHIEFEKKDCSRNYNEQNFIKATSKLFNKNEYSKLR